MGTLPTLPKTCFEVTGVLGFLAVWVKGQVEQQKAE